MAPPLIRAGTSWNIVDGAGYLLSLLIPILAALIVTTEWGQHTASNTFLFEPRRHRVVAAKGIVTGFIALFTFGFVIVLAWVAARSAGAPTVISASESTRLAGQCAELGFGAAQGFAWGLLLRNTPAAVCSNLFIPYLFTLLTGVLHLGHVGVWINPLLTQEPLASGSLSSVEWARLAVAESIWILLPLIVGLFHLRQTEIKP